MKIVGLISAYREGRLVEGAIRSLERVGLDDLIVFEGPAGKVPEGVEAAPESALEACREFQRLVHFGRWRSDARKRDAMLKEAQRRHHVSGVEPTPLWGVWVDGDEVLERGELLRDLLQSVLWQDEVEPEEPPTIRWPLRVVEADGSIAVTGSRLVRLDLIRSYDISVSVVTNYLGLEEAMGNVNEDARLWLDVWMKAVDSGRMIAWPPLPGEPFLVHRSQLRHPARRGLRLHHQEREKLIEAGKIRP